MFFHQKELIQPVKVGKPDARFGTFLLETFGHAEIFVRPSPAANDTRTNAVAIAIKAPEKIAAQLTAE